MKLYTLILISCSLMVLSSCSEDILIEEPLDFYSPENSYTKPIDIESALTHCYSTVRKANKGDYWDYSYLHFGTDLARYPRNTSSYFGNYETGLTPTSGTVSKFWSRYYRLIYDANVVLNRIEAIDYTDTELKNRHIAEARFFRAWAYRCLVHLYGGVPLVIEEISAPKRDFERTTKEQTLSFIIEELEAISVNGVLPDVDEVSADGKVNQAAAQHLLTEIYLTAGKNTEAVAMATKVIDNPSIELMTSRFGAKANEEGDPYWDLHQQGNQNRAGGNKEGIFVIQMDVTTPGGGAEDDYNYNNSNAISFERGYGPIWWQMKTPDGFNLSDQATSKQGGRPVAFVLPTDYVLFDIWGDKNDPNSDWAKDARNHQRNIRRDWLCENPNSEWYGKYTSEFPEGWPESVNPSASDMLMKYTPYITKVTTINDHPDFLVTNQELGWLNSSTGITYHDWYLMRVAETYLLRAEAYVLLGKTAEAAADINSVRERSNATPITAGEATIDYILDERLRELNYEEPRRMTLSRMGKLVERTQKYNSISGPTVSEKHELYPIPFSEIERNTLKELTQNPGYIN